VAAFITEQYLAKDGSGQLVVVFMGDGGYHDALRCAPEEPDAVIKRLCQEKVDEYLVRSDIANQV
jgi:hypothetical protein